MKRIAVALVGALLALPSVALAAEITVSAAASLTNAVTEVKTAYEAARPGTAVSLNFAASNPLLQQIREGAPVDVFASADQDTMNKAEKEKLIDPATRRDFVSNSLVLIVPKGNTAVKVVGDLKQATAIAVGNPDSVPAGRYARDALRSMELWETLAPKYIQGESVRQVLDYVSRGEVDAGIVYATDAFIAKDKVDIVETLSGHQPITYPVAVIATSKNPGIAADFVDYLVSPEGMAILQKYGFSPAQ